jgi:hypothetical protein
MRWATEAAASFPSIVTIRLAIKYSFYLIRYFHSV